MMLIYLKNTLNVYLQMSPYLLLGFFIAGILSKLIPQRWVQRHLAGDGYSPILKSAILGVPLPLCSCGVIPVMASLRKQGANVSAMLSFLLSTPQTGVDSILATYALLGLPFAIYRPVIAFVTAIIGGTVYYLLLKLKKEEGPSKIESDLSDSSNAEDVNGRGNGFEWRSFLFDTFSYGFIILPKEILKPLLFGIVIAGLVTTFFPPGIIGQFLSHSSLQILFAILIGIPIYVCATASIPVALSLIHLGVTPGAGLAFLISGPATNIATIGVVKKFLGTRALVIYVGTMIISAFFFGFTFDYLLSLFPNAGIFNFNFSHSGHTDDLGYIHIGSSIILTIVFMLSLSKRRLGNVLNASRGSKRETLEFLVEGMSCEHCVERVKQILKSIPGVEDVEVVLSSQKAIIYGLPSVEEVSSKLEKEGYKALFPKPNFSAPAESSSGCSCCS